MESPSEGTPAALREAPSGAVAVPVPVVAVTTFVADECAKSFALLNVTFVFKNVTYSFAEVLELCKGLKVLYLFSGPRRPDDFGVACCALGAMAKMVDVELDAHLMDLLDEAIFDTYTADLGDLKYDAALMSMPCATFSSGRASDDGGPIPLRGASAQDIYGLPGLSLRDKEATRIGTILALRGATVAKLCCERGLPWIGETPEMKEGQPSVLRLPEWQAILVATDVRRKTIVQCELGSVARKATELWGTVSLEGLPTSCSHPSKSWTVPWSGQSYWSPHPWLRGTQLAIPSEEWDAEMLRPRMPWGNYVTKVAAMYSGLMNRELAFRLLMAAGLRRAAFRSSRILVRTGYWSNALIRTDAVRRASLSSPSLASQLGAQKFGIKVTRANQARPVQVHHADVPHIGDLRNISSSVAKVSGHLIIGQRVRAILDKFLDDQPAVQAKCLHSIGRDVNQEHVISEDVLSKLRLELIQLFAEFGITAVPGAHLPCSSEDISSSVCGLLLHSWALAAADPAAPIALWFRDGAPAGITVPLDQLEGIMPMVSEQEPQDDPADLSTDYEYFTNHGNLDEDQEVQDTFKDLIERKFLKEFDSLEECQVFLGGELPILNKFACLVKYKWDNKAGWKMKRRIIMDSKRSGVKKASARKFKSVLPRVTDAISNLLAAMDDCRNTDMTDMEAEQFVIDATDAFWELGLHPKERRFFVGKINGKYLVYLRTAQGSRGAPLSWAAVFGLICRCVQSLFWKKHHTAQRAHFSADLQVYVDDPWAVVCGTVAQRDRSMALMILTWRIIGVRLAFSKARRGAVVDWIGASLFIKDRVTVVAKIMENRVSEVKHLTEKMLLSNVVSIQDLRSYTGKMQSMASLLHTWRPFVAMLWAALYAPPLASQAPAGCIWVAQIREPLSWFAAFWASPTSANLVRQFGIEAHFNRGKEIMIYVDASPYGLGAWLSVESRPVEFFSDKITETDCVMLMVIKNEGSKGQQAFEALGLLAAIRLWLPSFKHERVTVSLRSDNMAALEMVAKMQPKSKSLGVVARELALDLADSTYSLDFAQHVAGVTNGIADTLSRKFQPGKSFAVPQFLVHAKEVPPPVRIASWWRTKPAGYTA